MKKLICLLVYLIGPFAFAQQHIGNGGDPLQNLFLEAKTYAVERIQKINKCSFSEDTSADVKKWILNHKTDFVRDLEQTQQIWTTDTQATCAFTQAKNNSDVTLSFEACRPLITSVEKASHILIHESVHHFGITDEVLPEQVAKAIDLATLKDSCPIDLQEAFEPEACSGAPMKANEFLSHFSAGTSEVKIKNTTPMIFRSRKCLGTSEDSCTGWQYKAAGEVSTIFSIGSSNNPLVWMTTNFGCYGYGCIAAEYVEGVMTEQVSSSENGLSLYLQGEGQSIFKFKGTGRLTSDCLVMKSKIDLENEAGFLLRF